VAKQLHLQIVTPQSVIFSGEVDNFTVPGAVGPFQVLYNHTPIVSALVPGMFMYEINGKEQRYVISGGFLELHENKANVLATSAEKPEEINVARAEESKQRAEERLRDHSRAVDHDRARAALERANARIAALKPIRG
jgi:F-type H+-transporting ATPase subunit epsilon